jgi:hypothetical protein
MSNITIKGEAGLNGINFEFTSALNLIPNQPFPEAAFTNGEITVSSIKASADKKFTLGDDAGSVEFSADGEGFATLGVYRKAEKLSNALKKDGLSKPVANLLHLKIKDDENLLALRWGYGFAASVKGKVALAPIVPGLNLSFGASAQTTGLSVLLHTRKQTDSVADSIKNTLQSWRVPRQIKTIENLKPGTTVIYETMGKLDLSLGVEYGYNFNWVRESLEIGGLSGDLGLKIEMGLKAAFGFNAVGNYALALSRESDAQTIRAQVFNTKQHGWSFSFDGGISAQGTNKDLVPEKLDDFIKGVFNLHGSQILKDFEQWTSPNTKIKDLLGENLKDYAEGFVKKVTGIDVLETAVKEMKSLIERWHKLPHEITSYLYGLLGNPFDLKEKDKIEEKLNGELGKLREFLKKVVALAGNDGDLSDEITKHLKDIEFYNNPIGKWLTAASNQGILSLLVNIKSEKKQLKDFAEKTLALLDGSAVEKRLKNLQKEIEERLGLDKITNLNPDEWLKKRLADFLGKSEIIGELEEIKKAINKTREKAGEFYEKGYAALLRKYSFDVHYAFQKTTGNSALIDAALDFSGENAAEAEKLLAEILDGNFKTILTDTSIKCLNLNQAVLTHEIKRNVHLGVNIPYFSATLDHITNSIAGKKYVETADDKLWVYYVNAEDVVKKKKSLSRLAIAAELIEKAGIRKFNEENNELNYSFLYGKKEVDRKYIEQRYNFAAGKYLRSALPPETGSFSKYLTDLDKYLDKNGFPESDEFGTVLTSLKVSLPGSVMSFWGKVPEDYNTAPFYKSLSAVIQRTLREWIPLNYIQESKQYAKTNLIFPLLAYTSLNPLVGKRKSDGVFYWDYLGDDKKEEQFNSIGVQENLRQTLRNAQTSDSRYKDTNENIKKILEFVLKDQNGKSLFQDLCDLEEDIIKGVVKTAKAFHEFNKENDPQKKVAALADFGGKYTDTFNDEIGHIEYTPKGSLRPLGLLLFLEIVKLLMPELDDTKFAAMFEIFVLEPGISDKDFNKLRENFMQGELDEDKTKFVLRQRIVNIDSSPL